MSKKFLICLVCEMILLGFVGRVLGVPMRHYLYTQNFEDIDPVKFWVSNGKYTINFKGLTQEKFFSGKQSFKLDVTFKEGSYFYWCIPISSVPAEGKLKFSCRILVGDESTGTVGLGANIYFPPTSHSGCRCFSSYKTTMGEWKLIKKDLVKYGKKNADKVIPKYIWGVMGENVGVCVNKIGLFLRGRKGQRVVVYIDDIKIEGEVPVEEVYKKEIKKRWLAGKEKFLKKQDSWETALKEKEEQLSSLTNLSPEAEKMKRNVEEKIIFFKRKMEKIKKREFINLQEQRVIDSFLARIKDIINTLKFISQGRIKIKNLFLYVVSPISSVKILPFDTLIPGKISNQIKIVATPGEYEPASFVISALSDIKALKIKVTDFQGKNGSIPSKNIDVKVVKCWYQAGGAWYSFKQQKSKRILVPELLLNDDSLIKVDYKEKQNYLKLRFPEGEKYICISNPEEKRGCKILSVKDYPVKDSSNLLFVNIPKGTNKQFWVTVYVPDDTREGVYTGKIILFTENERLEHITLKLKVLPFKLASPKTYYNLNKDFTSSIYYRGRLHSDYPEGTISSEYKSKEQLRTELKDMFIHGITNPTVYQGFDEKLLGEYLKIKNEVGMVNQSLYYLGVRAYDDPSMIKKVIKFVESYGIKEVYFYGIDEARGEKLISQRDSWIQTRKAGGKVFVAGYRGSNFEAMGDVQDLLVCHGYPSKEEAEKWHSVCHKIWCYANPQSGVENPEIYRRNFGLLLWKSNYDGAATYAYQHSFDNIWNDFDHPIYRDHNFTYPTVNGVIDTIAWEGYREGIDDIKYATTLRLEIEKVKKLGNHKIKEVARDAEKYLESCNVKTGNLDTIRLEIIRYIIKINGGKIK